MSERSGTVLILEDQPLIALEVEDLFLDAGFGTVQIISSCADAESWLQANEPDVAIIDINLRDGPCLHVAETLLKRSIPFVVHSGALNVGEGSIFLKGRWVSKPSQPDHLLAAVDEILGTGLTA